MSRDERHEAEDLLIAALVQNPRRLVELKRFDRSWIEQTAHRAALSAAIEHHEQAAMSGNVRFATAQTIERRIRERYGTKTGDKRKDKARRVLIESVASLLDRLANHDRINEFAFAEAQDKIKAAGMDARAHKGMLRLIAHYERHGARGLTSELQTVAADVSPRYAEVGVSDMSVGSGNVLAEYHKAKSTPGAGMTPTSLPMLTRVLGGWAPGRLTLMCAYAKDGKTQLTKDQLYTASIEHGKHSVIVTAEQYASEVETMMLVRHTHKFVDGGINALKLRAGQLSAREEKALREAARDFQKNKRYGSIRYFRAPHGTTIGEAKSIIETMAQRTPVDIVMMDHTTLFSPTRREYNANTRDRVTDVLKELKQMSMDLCGKGAIVLAPHQINRDGYEAALTRGYYLPGDAAETSEAERSCDAMVWLLRTPELKDASEVRIGVAIDRNGPGEPRGWSELERYDSCAILPLSDDLP